MIKQTIKLYTLSGLLLLAVLPAKADQFGDFSYTTNGGMVTITSYTGAGGEVVIPPVINDLPVTSIEVGAFIGNSSLTSITIPNGVTNMGYAVFFGCTSLTSITIPGSVINIGSRAFGFCTKLTDITIPDSVTSLGTNTFQNCSSLTNATIGNCVARIGDNAFVSCTSLSSVTIPHSVISIGSKAFYYCTSLTSITIPDGVISIGDSAFVMGERPGSGSLTNVTFGNSVAIIGDRAFAFSIGLTSVTIPNTVTSIGNGSFVSCYFLTNVTFGTNVTSIGDGAFDSCHSLTDVTIPASVTNIGTGAFGQCYGMHQTYFLGNAPRVNGGVGSADTTVFQNNTSGTVLYLSNTTGWGATYGGWPTAVWQPQLQGAGYAGPTSTNGFGFNVNWASGQTVVVEASTNLKNWTPLITNTLVIGTNLFRDSNWTSYPQRFYCVRSP